MNNVDLVTTREAARRLGVRPQSVARLVERGTLTPALQLPGVRGAFLFDPAAIERLAQDREASR